MGTRKDWKFGDRVKTNSDFYWPSFETEENPPKRGDEAIVVKDMSDDPDVQTFLCVFPTGELWPVDSFMADKVEPSPVSGGVTPSQWMNYKPADLNAFIMKELGTTENLHWSESLPAALKLIRDYGSLTMVRQLYPNGSRCWIVRLYNQERFTGMSHGDTDEDLAYAIAISYYKALAPNVGHRDWVDEFFKRLDDRDAKNKRLEQQYAQKAQETKND